MFSIPNFYRSKHLRKFILIPILLMFVGILLSTQIVLDTSLKGGVSIILQTNSSLNTATLASEISSALHVESPLIAASPGGLQITLGINQSLANAESNLVDFYAHKENYTNHVVNATTLGLAHQHDPSNTTILNLLAQANSNANASIANMRNALQKELSALSTFDIGQYNATSSDPATLQASAQGAYSSASSIYQNDIIAGLHNVIDFSTYSYQQVTPTLGKFFLRELTNTIIIAFVLIFIVVFIIFRSIVPSFAVVFGAANDLVLALGAMGLFKIPLGIASVAGLLMLVGYSIDTDMLTTIRILRRGEGSPEDRAYSAMQTGITMTMTAIVSFAALFIISVIEYVPTYYQITSVVLMGLICDVVTTWLCNAPLMVLYQRKREGR